jgi:hypothetical protein
VDRHCVIGQADWSSLRWRLPYYPSRVRYKGAGMLDVAGVDQKIYGTKIVPLLKLKTATTRTTISAGTTFKSFIATRYRCAEIASVQNCTFRNSRNSLCVARLTREGGGHYGFLNRDTPEVGNSRSKGDRMHSSGAAIILALCGLLGGLLTAGQVGQTSETRTGALTSTDLLESLPRRQIRTKQEFW